jgi:hypothetical protein
MNRIEWNKLDSASSSSSPEIGTAWSVGSPTYTTGGVAKFGDGLVGSSSGIYKGIASGLQKISLDFWINPSIDNSGYQYWFVSAGTQIQIYTYGGNIVIICMDDAYVNGIGESRFIMDAFSSGDNVHFGISLDATAVKKCTVYQNGSELTESSHVYSGTGDWSSVGYAPVLGIQNNGYSGSANWIDDLVVWDDFKTDYSDRIYEGRVAPVAGNIISIINC